MFDVCIVALFIYLVTDTSDQFDRESVQLERSYFEIEESHSSARFPVES